MDMAGHHMSRYIADALAVLDDAGADKAAFVGYSFGARVGFGLGLTAPRLAHWSGRACTRFLTQRTHPMRCELKRTRCSPEAPSR